MKTTLALNSILLPPFIDNIDVLLQFSLQIPNFLPQISLKVDFSDPHDRRGKKKYISGSNITYFFVGLAGLN